MRIEDIISRRGIEEVLHFTTNQGLLGILDSGRLKSRTRLESDKRIEFIFKSNALFRKDLAWTDFVNLSISGINRTFFEVASKQWHGQSDIWWCILAFSPSILTYDGVYFTTTNNIYTGVKRGTGPDALESMFADSILRWSGNVIMRPSDRPSNQPTCEQAEVLYPGELSTEFLQLVYVPSGEVVDEIQAQLLAVGHPSVKVTIAPDKFKDS